MTGRFSAPFGMLLFVLSLLVLIGIPINAAVSLSVSGILFVVAVVRTAYEVWERTFQENETLKSKLIPKLKISFEQRHPWITKLPESTIPDLATGELRRVPSWWFGIQVHNLSSNNIAHACRVFLQDVEYSENGQYCFPTQFGNSQVLRWSQETTEPYSPRDISSLERRFADVLSVDPVYNAVLIKWQTEWQANKELFQRHGYYRLTICATSQDAGTVVKKLIVNWNGYWDQIDVTSED